MSPRSERKAIRPTPVSAVVTSSRDEIRRSLTNHAARPGPDKAAFIADNGHRQCFVLMTVRRQVQPSIFVSVASDKNIFNDPVDGAGKKARPRIAYQLAPFDIRHLGMTTSEGAGREAMDSCTLPMNSKRLHHPRTKSPLKRCMILIMPPARASEVSFFIPAMRAS